ncbi:MAG: preprotein translocase subunit SecE [Erysipelotrichales bacterium]|nr:preprotein translocase subunit SecE [Erysipelotrichales bacterium]
MQRNEIGKRDTYLRDVKKEMSMVRWPSAKEVVKYSIASLAFVAFFALFFYGIDAIFALVKDLVS